jgi:hypothetical protein
MDRKMDRKHAAYSQYRVAMHQPPHQPQPPCAACCWVEVYDRNPVWEKQAAIRLKAGYISEAKDTLQQLEALLPLEEWADLFCMTPGCVGGEVYFLGKELSRFSRGALQEALDSADAHKNIYQERRPLGKLQLVIVRR